MSEKPLLMQSEMVRATLSGAKTQTRRVVKLRDPSETYSCFDDDGWPKSTDEYGDWHRDKCPYGKVDDKLWIREKQRVVDIDTRLGRKIIKVRYEADGTESNWLVYPDRLKGVPKIGQCLSYGGYRESSRLTLEITDIRVERVQGITGGDVSKEGYQGDMPLVDGMPWFIGLWNSINEKRGLGWKFNPWVWVVEFKLIKGA